MLQPDAVSAPRERTGLRRVALCLLGTVAVVCWLAAPPSSARTLDLGALAAPARVPTGYGYPQTNAMYGYNPSARTPDQDLHQGWATDYVRWSATPAGYRGPQPASLPRAPNMQAPPQAPPQTPQAAPRSWSQPTNAMWAADQRFSGGPTAWATNAVPAQRPMGSSSPPENTVRWATDSDSTRRFREWGPTGRYDPIPDAPQHRYV